jgi:peptide methionine sulfoxide reductase msrA/msrB
MMFRNGLGRVLIYPAIAALILWTVRAHGGSDGAAATTQPEPAKMETNMKTEQATFAAGCFWGVEAAFRKVNGVVSTQVGYTGGHTVDPTYKDVCTDDTGHAEAVLVTFDPARVSYPELLDAFWTCHDPTTVDQQGPDFGSQYRSAIFFHDAEQERQARASIKEVDASGVFKRKIVTQIEPAEKFYTAEEYHQRYFEKQGTAATCHVGVATVHTKLAAEAAARRQGSATQPTSCAPDKPDAACGVSHWQVSDDELRSRLSPQQYAIARQAGTERAFSGKYWNEHRPGIYRCAVCGQDLFDAATKFDSGTGWPSYWSPLNKDAVIENDDNAHGMHRTEVLCARCHSHLGHVFDDGPRPTGKRYCMNSAVLDLNADAKPTT